MNAERTSRNCNSKRRYCLHIRLGARLSVMVAAGTLVGTAPAWAWDEPAGTGSDFIRNIKLEDPAPAADNRQDGVDESIQPTRIVLRDPSFGFNFIAFLPKYEKKQSSPPRVVALLEQPWTAVGAERLDESRGGFDAGGLVMSFGIERAVYINGNLVTTTSFNVSDVGKITSDQMKTLTAQAASMGLVQNGPGNTFQLTTGNASLPGSIIQNTLNNQNIKSTTVINATSNSLNLIKGINTFDTFNNAINNSLGHH
ncbi:MAG: hypothetical protein V4634_06585 [Pseudomonadota bacterium]